MVIAVFSVISSASYPIINNFGAASAYNSAQAKAEALTAAKIIYAKSDADADTDWSTAADDDAKFALLLPYFKDLDEETTLADFAADAPYHQFTLGAQVHSLVSVVDPD